MSYKGFISLEDLGGADARGAVPPPPPPPPPLYVRVCVCVCAERVRLLPLCLFLCLSVCLCLGAITPEQKAQEGIEYLKRVAAQTASL